MFEAKLHPVACQYFYAASKDVTRRLDLKTNERNTIKNSVGPIKFIKNI